MIIGLFTSMAFAQSYTISGTVKDVNGESIFGASVVIAGTVQGDAAGIDGSFAIEDVTPGNYTLRVSAIGYSSFEQNVTVSSSDVVLNFVLDPESATLEELKVFDVSKYVILLLRMSTKTERSKYGLQKTWCCLGNGCMRIPWRYWRN